MENSKELKTLKDLQFEIKEIPHAGWLVWAHKEREEAIKWIKEINKAHKKHWEELSDKGYVCMEEPYTFKVGELEFESWHEASEDRGAVMILKHFFNISDEDLK